MLDEDNFDDSAQDEFLLRISKLEGDLGPFFKEIQNKYIEEIIKEEYEITEKPNLVLPGLLLK